MIFRFKDVRFSYDKNEEVLKGVYLDINSGETIAIVGATGAGKSTIINLLNRFYDIDSGEIAIDGTDIQKFSLNSLREQIAVVLQDVFLFADTILNNITLNNPIISEADVIAAAKAIGIHDFIIELTKRLPLQCKGTRCHAIFGTTTVDLIFTCLYD